MGQGYSFGTGNITTTAATLKGIAYVRPPTKVDMKIVGWSITLDAAAAAQGGLLEICRVTTLGTPSGTSTPTIVKRNPYGPASDSLGARTGATGSLPTADVFETYHIPPNGGGMKVQYPLGREPIFKANDSNDAFYIRFTPASGTSPNVAVTVEWEEGA